MPDIKQINNNNPPPSSTTPPRTTPTKKTPSKSKNENEEKFERDNSWMTDILEKVGIFNLRLL